MVSLETSCIQPSRVCLSFHFRGSTPSHDRSFRFYPRALSSGSSYHLIHSHFSYVLSLSFDRSAQRSVVIKRTRAPRFLPSPAQIDRTGTITQPTYAILTQRKEKLSRLFNRRSVPLLFHADRVSSEEYIAPITLTGKSSSGEKRMEKKRK